MSELPKYARMEIERRWLVDLATMSDLANLPSRTIEDRYIEGTQLRLRKIDGPGLIVEYKFGKKYGKHSSLSEPVTNLYLQELEYAVLSKLPARVCRKRRYAVSEGSLDVYETPSAGTAIFEIEFRSEAMALAYSPPSFVTKEVTADPEFSGAAFTATQNR